MFYLDKVTEMLLAADALTKAAMKHVNTPEFAAEVQSAHNDPDIDIWPSKLGHVEGVILCSQLGHAARLAQDAQTKVSYMERLTAACEAIGIDESMLPWLELIAEDKHYRSELSDLADRIREAADEIRSDLAEREHDNTVTILKAAGFVNDPDSDAYTGLKRDTPAPSFSVAIELARDGSGYTYTLECAGVEALRGKSGEFASLLSAVGITQEVPAK